MNEQKKQHKIYRLGLHGSYEESGFRITRVAGGWIYQSFGENEGEITSSVFVPFSNEFQTREF